MTKLLNEALALASTLPDDEQDRVAQVVFAYTRGLDEHVSIGEQLFRAPL